MKKPLLFAMLVIGLSSTAQMKLTSAVLKNYSDAITLDMIDSTQYNYTWNMGIMNSHSPEFTIFGNAPVYLFQYDRPTLDYTTREIWSASNYPLSQVWGSTKTYNGSNLCTSDEGIGFRELFTYSTSGKLATHTYESETSPGIWEVQERMDYFYDASDRLIANYRYDGGLSFYTNKDSVWYDGTTNNVTIKKYYESADGLTFDLISKSETFWAAGKPDYAKYYEDEDSDPLTPVTWLINAEYTFSGNNCTKIEAFAVIAGMPTTTILAQWDYSFNGSNQLTSDVQSGGFGDARADYTYQANGLLETIDSQQDQGSGMYTYRFEKFHYTNVAGLTEENIDFQVYPNPTVDKVVLSQTYDQVQVYTMNGQLVLSQKNTNLVDLSSFEAGNYLITVSSSKGTGTQTVVKN